MGRPKSANRLLAPVIVATVAIVCCAALPAVAGASAGLALATILGVGGGLVGLIAALSITVMIVRARRRRSRPSPGQRPAS
jgi:uncharacterized membrane protein YedE/YeeE